MNFSTLEYVVFCAGARELTCTENRHLTHFYRKCQHVVCLFNYEHVIKKRKIQMLRDVVTMTAFEHCCISLVQLQHIIQ